MYPIHCPVISGEWALINLGALERPLTEALQSFTNMTGTLSVPLISAGWSSMTSMPLSSLDPKSFVTSMRRLEDEAEALATRFREIEERESRRNEQRELQQRESGAKKSTSTLAIMGTAFDPERLQEMKARPSSRPPAHGTASRGRWQLAVTPRGRGGPFFISEDGRAVHLHRVTITSAVLGYGWQQSAMHYLDIDHSHPLGKSVALFTNEEIKQGDYSVQWLSNLFLSLWEFHQDGHESWDPKERKFLVSGMNNRRAPIKQTISGDDPSAVADLFRSLSLSDSFTLESERLVDGTRNPTLTAANPPTPLARIEYVVQNGFQPFLRRSWYRSARTESLGETGLPEGVKRQLRFPATWSTTSRIRVP